MNAIVFMPEGEDQLFRTINHYLQEHIYRDINVRQYTISSKPEELYYNDSPDYIMPWEEKIKLENNINKFTRYLEHMKASMVKVSDFSLGLFNNKGQWGYVGYANDKLFLRLSESSLHKLFPAVAIMDRMMLIPSEIHECFEKDMELSWLLKPLDAHGVFLTDFQDKKAIRKAVIQVGNHIKDYTARLCRRHMQARKIQVSDLDELAKLLKVDMQFLHQFKDEINLPHVRLSSKVVSGPVKLETPSKVMIEIKDVSEQKVENLLVKVRLPDQTLVNQDANPVFFTESITLLEENDRAQVIEFEVIPRAVPFCPVEVMFELQDINPAYTPFPVPLLLDVVP
jgi:hypothetical protein